MNIFLTKAILTKAVAGLGLGAALSQVDPSVAESLADRATHWLENVDGIDQAMAAFSGSAEEAKSEERLTSAEERDLGRYMETPQLDEVYPELDSAAELGAEVLGIESLRAVGK